MKENLNIELKIMKLSLHIENKELNILEEQN